ncbi:hypothetical protein MPER_07781 [Moniliophthora perniciosa FA553]|nr:hypothetical protein MPER_07781 [Moniliophthora perniciosa FA553]
MVPEAIEGLLDAAKWKWQGRIRTRRCHAATPTPTSYSATTRSLASTFWGLRKLALSSNGCDFVIPGFSLISNTNVIIRGRRYTWIAATSHLKLSTKVNYYSRNQWPRDYDVVKVSRSHLDIDIDAFATFSTLVSNHSPQHPNTSGIHSVMEVIS